IYVGNQSLGPAGSITPIVGIINVNGTGKLIANSTLMLATNNAVGEAGKRTSGQLNIRNGTVMANRITVGAQSTNTVITMTNGTLVVSNTIASPALGLTRLAITNSTLQLFYSGVTNVVVTNLVSGGATNII